jgi:hypothetical protein
VVSVQDVVVVQDVVLAAVVVSVDKVDKDVVVVPEVSVQDVVSAAVVVSVQDVVSVVQIAVDPLHVFEPLQSFGSHSTSH